jgi:hypothetical protein
MESRGGALFARRLPFKPLRQLPAAQMNPGTGHVPGPAPEPPGKGEPGESTIFLEDCAGLVCANLTNNSHSNTAKSQHWATRDNSHIPTATRAPGPKSHSRAPTNSAAARGGSGGSRKGRKPRGLFLHGWPPHRQAWPAPDRGRAPAWLGRNLRRSPGRQIQCPRLKLF